MGASLIPAGIGAGLGLLSSLFNKPQTQTTTQTPDTGYLSYLNNVVRPYAGGAASNPYVLAAANMFNNAGGQSPNAAMAQYLQAFGPYFQMLAQQGVTSANEQATREGAFGGTGSQIGAAVANNLVGQQQTQGAYTAYQDSLNRMLQAGAGLAGLPGVVNSTMAMGLQPSGSTSTTSVPTYTNPFLALLGGGLAGYGASMGFGGGANLGMGFAGNQGTTSPGNPAGGLLKTG